MIKEKMDIGKSWYILEYRAYKDLHKQAKLPIRIEVMLRVRNQVMIPVQDLIRKITG